MNRDLRTPTPPQDQTRRAMQTNQPYPAAPIPMWTQLDTEHIAPGTYAILTNHSDQLWFSNWILAQQEGAETTQQNALAYQGRLELSHKLPTEAQLWTIAQAQGGVTVQNCLTRQFLDLSVTDKPTAVTSPTPVTLTLTYQPQTHTYTITQGSRGLAYEDKAYKVSPNPTQLRFYTQKPGTPRLISDRPETGQTHDQPFPSGTGGSKLFRIPALVTLSDGTIVAAIDARWGNGPDGFNTETMVSISQDNGKTWNYQFVNVFKDAISVNDDRSTAFIDPVLIRDRHDTIYLITDLYPNGKFIGSADDATGFEDIGGTKRMVLYSFAERQTSHNYTHVLGDQQPDGFSPVYDKDDATRAVAFLDPFFMLYDAQKQPLLCRQLGSYDLVQQNVFFQNACLHVRNATYLCLRKSTDRGRTWSTPAILNPQVRKTDGTCRFYGMGPGAGLCLDNGMLLAPAYTNPTERSSFIYSQDGGKTWKRSQDATTDCWSSESALVQIAPDRIRQIHRNGSATILYTDHLWDGNQWLPQKTMDTGVVKTIRNQISAIRYSKLIDGKPAILVSTAATGTNRRARGTIYTFLLNEDLTMTLAYSYLFTPDSCDYSSITELMDGSIGLLYEEKVVYPKFLHLTMDQLAPNATLTAPPKKTHFCP